MPQSSQNLHNFTILTQTLGYWSLAGFCFILVTVLSSCSEPVPDEQRIQQRVEAMVAGTQEKSLSDVMEPIHQDFLGNKVIRKANLKGLVLVHFRRHKNVHVLVSNLTITLNGDTAKVSCNVVLAGRNQTLPERARVLQVESDWEKIEGDWFVVRASWEDPIMKF